MKFNSWLPSFLLIDVLLLNLGTSLSILERTLQCSQDFYSASILNLMFGSVLVDDKFFCLLEGGVLLDYYYFYYNNVWYTGHRRYINLSSCFLFSCVHLFSVGCP